MANPHRGEVGFTGLDGKDYVLCFSINALCEIDDALGVEDAVTTLVASGKAKLKHFRTMFCIGLRVRHPDITDERAAADLVTPRQMVELLTRAFELAFPPVQPGALAADPRPPGQESGETTGPASSSTSSLPASTPRHSGVSRRAS
jgi:hypothetical protein